MSDVNNIIPRMNRILDNLKKDFPDFFEFPMKFSENEESQLCFNDRKLCVVSDLILESAEYDLGSVWFYFNKNQFIHIELDWKEDSYPTVGTIMFGHDLHEGDGVQKFEIIASREEESYITRLAEEMGVTFADEDEIPDEDPEEVMEYGNE